MKHMEDREVIRDSMDKLCLTNLVAFYDEVAALVDKGRVTDVICLEFCKDFDIVPQIVLSAKLEKYRFQDWTVQYIRNCQSGCIQRVVVNSSISKWKPVRSDVATQGTELGPIQSNFIIFQLNNTNSGTEYSLRNFADSITLRGRVDWLVKGFFRLKKPKKPQKT